ncbi:heavy metal translocating P-type ATPase [Virgibacillus sp. W0181]|uniref:heavy metal translocating P-type ATPase n=1 Tax=Virgibacillus sp. W0181 TaxID=3391581 RepID=UPI003F46B3A3
MASNAHIYRLQGLSCMNCAAKFEKNIRSINTVEDVQVNFGASKLKINGEATIEQLEKAGAFDGIKVLPDRQQQPEKKEPFWKKRENILTMISLLFIIVGYLFYFQLGAKAPFTIGTFALAILIGGYDLFKVGFKNLAKLEFDMKTLMTIAVIGAAIIGEWGEGAIVVFLFALSEALESYSINKARQSISSLINIAPNKATIKHGNVNEEVNVEDVRINDIMVIKPGEKAAMDGEVVKGESSLNQAAITGESIPVHKTFGDEVFAGTINQEGYLEVRVTKRVEDTTIAKIIHLVEEAQAERAPSQQFVDKFAKYYTPAIMIIALLVAILPPLIASASWSEWVYLGLAVLVVGCPCALVISTPVAIVTAIGNAARNGILIKGGIHLEETGRLNVIAFDKTGTLTEGKPEVTDIVPVGSFTESEILSISRSIEAYSQHPLASAIIQKAKREKAKEMEAENFQSITGKGAKAVISGEEFFIGNPALFEEISKLPVEIKQQIDELQAAGKTVMVLGTNSDIYGLIAVADKIRNSSFSIMKQLLQLGIKKTVMLTGDNKTTAVAIGKELGISETRADLLPEDKLDTIKELQASHGNVAMVGDGVNDAPALATSSVGIAMGGAGTDTALETADIALMADDLEKLPYTISLSRKALHIIKQNIGFALGVKIIALLLVIPGWLTLWLAIIADVGATLLVVLNSMRLMNGKEKNKKDISEHVSQQSI